MCSHGSGKSLAALSREQDKISPQQIVMLKDTSASTMPLGCQSSCPVVLLQVVGINDPFIDNDYTA